MSIIFWTNEKTLQFIDAVRQRPGVWDIEHSAYKNRNSKKDIWKIIGNEFGITGEEAYKKFRSLRTYAKNEFKNAQKKTASGKPVAWFAYDAMKFILSSDNTDSLDSENITVDTQFTEQSEADDEDLLPPSCPPQARKKKFQQHPNTAALEAAIEIFNNSNRKRQNPFSGFAEHVASKLSSYDQYTRTQVEFQISKILYDADMSMIGGSRLFSNTPSTLDGLSPASLKETAVSPQVTFDLNFTRDVTGSDTTVTTKSSTSNANTECKYTVKLERRSSE